MFYFLNKNLYSTIKNVNFLILLVFIINIVGLLFQKGLFSMTGIQNLSVIQNASGVTNTSADINNKNLLLNTSNLERTPKTDVVSFSSTVNQTAPGCKREASTGKKWGVGIASFFVPGLGQAVNGQWGKGAGFFFGHLGLGYLAHTINPIFGWGLLALRIWSTADSVCNVKPDYEG